MKNRLTQTIIERFDYRRLGGPAFAMLLFCITRAALGDPVQVGPALSFGGHEYRLYAYQLNDDRHWTVAKAFAAGIGTRLVSINSAEENQFLLNNFVLPSLPGTRSDGWEYTVWTGGTDETEEGTWVWDGDSGSGVFWSGGPASGGGFAPPGQFANWFPSEPNNPRNDDYLVFILQGATIATPGTWFDAWGGQPDFADPVGGLIVETSQTQCDTFDGTILETDKWVVTSPIIGGSVIQNDALYLTTDGVEPSHFCFAPEAFGGGPGIGMRRKLGGDLDIQVNFRAFDGAYDGATQAFFQIYQDGDLSWRGNQLHIKRIRTPDGDFLQTVASVNGVFPIQTGSPNAATSGTFRIVRIGSQITTYFDGVEDFSLEAFSGPVVVSMHISGPGSGGSIVYDNFCINSGTLVEPPLSCGAPTPTPTASPTPACTYSPADDFSATMNPNGSWTFGYTAVLGGTLVVYDATKIGDGVNYWYRSDHPNAPFPPEVGHNPNGAFVQAGNIDWTANGFHLHPGPDGSFSVARWTAGTSGTFDVNAVFAMADDGATDVHLLYNSVPIFNDVIAGRADSSSLSTVIPVIAGDIIDFSVGPAGDYFDDSTALLATISTSCLTPSPTPTPPEPSATPTPTATATATPTAIATATATPTATATATATATIPPSPTPTPTPTPTPACAAQVQLPINADGTSIFNARRGVVPVKFRLTCNGTPTCDLPPATIAVTRTAGGVIGEINESAYSSQADSGSNFRVLECQYHYNLNSSALGVGTYRVEILINGQVVGSATFQLK